MASGAKQKSGAHNKPTQKHQQCAINIPSYFLQSFEMAFPASAWCPKSRRHHLQSNPLGVSTFYCILAPVVEQIDRQTPKRSIFLPSGFKIGVSSLGVVTEVSQASCAIEPPRSQHFLLHFSARGAT